MTALNPSTAQGGYLWYVVITHVGQERLAKYQLERQGFDVYLPMIPPPATARTRNGVPPAPRPMVPRYLFVCVDVNKPGWSSIRSTMGVHDVIMRGSGETAKPSPIPNRFIEEIQNREVNGLVILPHRSMAQKAAAARQYRRGDKFRVSGPTADYDFIFQEMVDGDRAKVIFTLLGRESVQVISLPS